MDITNPLSPILTGYYKNPKTIFYGADLDDEGNIFSAERFNLKVYEQDMFDAAGGNTNGQFIAKDCSFAISPNPFNARTTISFTLQAAGMVSLEIFDVTGRYVGARRALPLQHQWYPAGQHQVTFDGKDLTSGIYFVRLNTGGQTAVNKILLLK